MTTTLIIQIILIGLGAGLFSGMFGIGGGIIILPTLTLLFQWDIHLATGTSLAALLLPTNFIALNNYRKKGFLYIKGSALVALGMILGNYLGATFALSIGGEYIKISFGIYQIIVGIKYLKPIYILNKFFYPELAKKEKPTYKPIEDINFYIFLIMGICGGILAGMFGIGGGLIITTILISIYNINPKQAVVISLAAMFLPTGIMGVTSYYYEGYVNIIAAILIAIGIEFGSNFSSRIALKLDTTVFKQFFGLFLIVLGIYFIFGNFLK